MNDKNIDNIETWLLQRTQAFKSSAKLQYAIIIHRMLSCIGVDSKIVIVEVKFIVISLGVNRPLDLMQVPHKVTSTQTALYNKNKHRSGILIAK